MRVERPGDLCSCAEVVTLSSSLRILLRKAASRRRTGAAAPSDSPRPATDATPGIRLPTRTAHVRIDIGGTIATAAIKNEAVDELGLEIGETAFAIVAASDVMAAYLMAGPLPEQDQGRAGRRRRARGFRWWAH
ncbi:MAG: TOBE domain-containing protein [Hyphomicrobiales bacterium]|nr:TOBE domain-containing protein [Hyphomicrobiales bacterium]